MANNPFQQVNQIAKSLNGMAQALGSLGLVICGSMLAFTTLVLMFGNAKSRTQVKNHFVILIISTGMFMFLSGSMKMMGTNPSASQQAFTTPTKKVTKVRHRPALTYGKHIQYNSNSHMHMMTQKSLDHPKIVDEK